MYLVDMIGLFEVKMKLHLGCGNKHIEGFVNVDARDLAGVDLVDEISLLGKFKENSVELIYASHVLEHTGRLTYMQPLQRWYDVLKPGGTLRIAVPDIGKVAEHYMKFGNLKLLRGFLWGGQNYPQNFHYMGWDFSCLKEDLEAVGFKNVRHYDWRETEHAHIDDFSQAYLPHLDKDHGLLMSLNLECTK